MLIEQFINNKEALTVLRNSLSSLNRINFFAVMLEMGAKRSRLQPSSHPMETAAITGSWHNGYVAAIEDVFNFIDNIVEKKEQAVVDFGALKALLDSKEITQAEYDELRATKEI